MRHPNLDVAVAFQLSVADHAAVHAGIDRNRRMWRASRAYKNADQRIGLHGSGARALRLIAGLGSYLGRQIADYALDSYQAQLSFRFYTYQAIWQAEFSCPGGELEPAELPRLPAARAWR